MEEVRCRTPLSQRKFPTASFEVHQEDDHDVRNICNTLTTIYVYTYTNPDIITITTIYMENNDFYIRFNIYMMEIYYLGTVWL